MMQTFLVMLLVSITLGVVSELLGWGWLPTILLALVLGGLILLVVPPR